eukprot:1494273-Amphidinium_carterae.1
MRDELHGATSMAACEAHNEQLREEVKSLQVQLADALSQLQAQKSISRHHTLAARSAVELTEGDML